MARPGCFLGSATTMDQVKFTVYVDSSGLGAEDARRPLGWCFEHCS